MNAKLFSCAFSACVLVKFRQKKNKDLLMMISLHDMTLLICFGYEKCFEWNPFDAKFNQNYLIE